MKEKGRKCAGNKENEKKGQWLKKERKKERKFLEQYQQQEKVN